MHMSMFMEDTYLASGKEPVNLVWKDDASLWFEVERSEGASVMFSEQLLGGQDTSGLAQLSQWSLVSVCK